MRWCVCWWKTAWQSSWERRGGGARRRASLYTPCYRKTRLSIKRVSRILRVRANMDHTRLLQRPLVHNDNADLGSNITTWFHQGGECDHSGPAQPSEGTLRPGLTVAICTYKRA